tara:strand:- start:593 stop:811 length:219 start_codon:yes stop_codon:yes gene_type:complete
MSEQDKRRYFVTELGEIADMLSQVQDRITHLECILQNDTSNDYAQLCKEQQETNAQIVKNTVIAWHLLSNGI